jgi:hypothetical protein
MFDPISSTSFGSIPLRKWEIALRTRLFRYIPFRPVAPLHACLASSRTTLVCGPVRLRILYAMLAPEMPEPIMTTSAVSGRLSVERKPAISLSGGSCQHEMVGLSRGRDTGIETLCSIVKEDDVQLQSSLHHFHQPRRFSPHLGERRAPLSKVARL